MGGATTSGVCDEVTRHKQAAQATGVVQEGCRDSPLAWLLKEWTILPFAGIGRLIGERGVGDIGGALGLGADSQGRVYVAGCGGKRIVRYGPVRDLPTPSLACALRGTLARGFRRVRERELARLDVGDPLGNVSIMG